MPPQVGGVVEDTYNDYYKKNTKYFRRVIK